MKRKSKSGHIPSPALPRFIWFLAALMLIPALAGSEPVSITDDLGREVRLEQPARRVIALYGAFNEMLSAMGMEQVIIARTKADELPASIVDLPCIGTHLRPNVESVVGLGPDLVLQMGGRKDASEPLTAIERYGVPTAFFSVSTVEELYSVIRRLGVLIGAEEQAGELIESMRARLDKVAERIISDSARPGVVFEVRSPNLLTAGQGSIVTDVIRLAGGENAVQGPGRLVRLNEEEVVRLDPDAYVVQVGVMNPAPSDVFERERFRTIRAVKDGRVLVVDEALFSRPGPRIVEAIEILADFLHPNMADKEVLE